MVLFSSFTFIFFSLAFPLITSPLFCPYFPFHCLLCSHFTSFFLHSTHFPIFLSFSLLAPHFLFPQRFNAQSGFFLPPPLNISGPATAAIFFLILHERSLSCFRPSVFISDHSAYNIYLQSQQALTFLFSPADLSFSPLSLSLFLCYCSSQFTPLTPPFLFVFVCLLHLPLFSYYPIRMTQNTNQSVDIDGKILGMTYNTNQSVDVDGI